MTFARGVLMTTGVAALAVAAAAYAETRAPEPPTPGVQKKVVIFRSGGSWLGVQIADVNADRAGEIGLKEERGAEIQSVSPGSPAEEAGLRKGDVILEYQGNRIESVMQLTRLVRETPAGRSATLRVFRDGSERTIQVKVAERGGSDGDAPEAMRHIEILRGDGDGSVHRIEIPDVPGVPEIPNLDLEELENLDIPGMIEMHGIAGRPRLGAVVDDVGPQLAEYFGLKQEGGVLVKSVKKGSPGDTAGLKAGDVIIRVNGESVEDASDLRLALRGSGDKEVKVTIVRDRREQTLTVPPAPEPQETPRAHRPGGHPAAMREDIERQLERALRQAEAARAASVDVEEVRARAMRAIEAQREAIEKALRDGAVAAPEGVIEEDGVEDIRTPAAPRPDEAREAREVSDTDRGAIRRAAEEARRIRIEMQNSGTE